MNQYIEKCFCSEFSAINSSVFLLIRGTYTLLGAPSNMHMPASIINEWSKLSLVVEMSRRYYDHLYFVYYRLLLTADESSNRDIP